VAGILTQERLGVRFVAIAPLGKLVIFRVLNWQIMDYLPQESFYA